MQDFRDRPAYLLGCEAQVADEDGMFTGEPPIVCLIGLFDIIEYCVAEPSAYVHSPLYIVCPHGEEEGITYSVNAYDLEQQVDPKSHGRQLVNEREMVFAEEEESERFHNHRLLGP